ncbi:MAG: DedA family protein [Alicyclobacillus sp.]|nr:DedA family protein [Alicyclobacillus sp.]
MVHWVQSSGYLAILLAMAVESMCIPLPSEVIMPFGGYLAGAGHLNLVGVVVCGVVGNIIGSLVAYGVGRVGGRSVVMRYGRYVGLTERRMAGAERWFERRGEWAVFVARLLPAARTFISLPAGIARMPVGPFTLYTALGSIPWVAVLAYAGFKLGRNWDVVKRYVDPLLYAVVVVVVLAAVYGVIRWVRRRPTGGRR